MIKLTKRLEIISNFANVGLNTCDVGCDHGYVLIDLASKNNNIELLGIENKNGPYRAFLSNIRKYKLDKRINYSLSDGLDNLTENYKCLILAGMGYDNIKKIVNKNVKKLDYIDYIVVDSHNKLYDVRKFFNSLGYSIDDEEIVEENSIFYEIIRFKKGIEILNDDQLTFGPILLNKKGEIFLKKYSNIIAHNKEIINQLPDGTTKEEFIYQNKRIEDIL